MIESVNHGVRQIALSRLIRECSSQIAIARLGWTNEKRAERIYSAGVDRLGTRYDWRHLIQIWWRIRRGKGSKHEADGKLICSELVADCFAQAGYHFNYHAAGFISPADIASEPGIRFLGRLV